MVVEHYTGTMVKTALALLLSLLFLTGCNKVEVTSMAPSHLNEFVKGYERMKDVRFGKTPDLTLDLYKPITVEGNPSEVVILLHGGGWTSGDKSFLKPTVDILLGQSKNMAIVNMNYRLTSENSSLRTLLEVQLADLGNAIKYLKDNATKYNIRTDNFRIVGFSSGGHIALTYAYSAQDPTVNTVIAVSAPTELSIRSLLDRSLWPRVELLTGKKYSDSLNVFKEDSPFYLASPRSPRTSLVYGQQDVLVSPVQGQLLADKLHLLRVPCALTVIQGETHELTPERAAIFILKTYE